MSFSPASPSAANPPLALPLRGPDQLQPARLSQRTYLRLHLWQPLSAFVLLSWVLMGMGGDGWLADQWFAMQGHAWTLQSSSFLQEVLHAGGRAASKMAWYAVLSIWLLSLGVNRMRALRMPLAYLLISTLLATALVGWMKRWTHMDCPWDLLRYGGDKAYYGLFARLPAGVRAGSCFPAGHASAGYAWMALYFFFERTWPELQRWGLGFGLVAGMTFGLAQQLRGAHFLSHDLWALAISWLVALALRRLMPMTTERMRAKRMSVERVIPAKDIA